jgi:hypothetical protein
MMGDGRRRIEIVRVAPAMIVEFVTKEAVHPNLAVTEGTLDVGQKADDPNPKPVSVPGPKVGGLKGIGLKVEGNGQ